MSKIAAKLKQREKSVSTLEGKKMTLTGKKVTILKKFQLI
jgi:hypothetical protein